MEPQVPMPPRLVDLKKQLIPENSKELTKAWEELLATLAEETALFKREGSNASAISQGGYLKAKLNQSELQIIPQVDFSELTQLTEEDKARIKRRGCVVIRNVVDDAEALQWKQDLVEFVRANPDVEGFPKEDKQFFQLYWTRSQVRARSHPNVLASGVWLNKLYHFSRNTNIEGVELSTPLAYADRFRIRKPGGIWNDFPPHIDGGSIERWEDPAFRSCFASILEGKWKEHDPYDVEKRLEAKTSLYGRPNQSSVFRTFQGWLAMSETGPSEGTLKIFPNVILSNAYLILRPFFRLKEHPVSDNLLGPENWEFDISSPDFPGIFADPEKGFRGPRLSPKSHPHMNLETSMISMPRVNPGDMVFWHCDGVHSVEVEHTGKGDSAVMYIPAVPLTPQNAAYITLQRTSFLSGATPPDFPVTIGEGHCQGVGKVDDIDNTVGRRAMGLPIEVA